MTILSVVGARPQFIKAAVVSHALREAGLAEMLVHTGQHYDAEMSAIFFEELGVPAPAHNLSVGSGPHGRQTGLMLERLEEVMERQRPAGVLIYGDTNSTLAAALAAAKLGIPLAHVEAGLRSFRRHMPEEINRVVADRLSDILFAPTDTAVANLAREGIAGANVHQVGDVMLDTAMHFASRAEARSTLLKKLALQPKGYAVATIHRAENTDDAERLRAIFSGFSAASAAIDIVVPLHPRTRQRLESFHLDLTKLRVIPPVGYLDMIALLKNARIVLTDSGGVQKEACFHGTPCLTLRDETEWVELVQMGWNRLVPPVSMAVVSAAIVDAIASPPPATCEVHGLFGDGKASARIADVLRGSWS